MRTVEIDTPENPVAMYLGALLSSRKRPGTVVALPEVTYVRPQVVLESAHIESYSKICGFDEAHGVPVTYPQMLAFPLLMAFFASPDCPWPGLGTVHLANTIRQRQQLNAGDTLRVEMRGDMLMAHPKGQVFTLEIKILRADSVVWEATQSLLRVRVKNPTGAAFVSEFSTDLPLSHQADVSAARDIGRRFGRVSGDFNPIHLSAWSARLFGFRRSIAHGMWTKARALAVLMPRKSVTQARVAVEFKMPLFLPARASLWATHNAPESWFEVRNAKGDKPHMSGHLSYL